MAVKRKIITGKNSTVKIEPKRAQPDTPYERPVEEPKKKKPPKGEPKKYVIGQSNIPIPESFTAKRNTRKKRVEEEPVEEEIKEVVQEMIEEVFPETIETLQEAIQQEEQKLNESKGKFKWDVPISSDIDYFDANLSYELTGYIPITDKQSLDFNPKWFTEARDTYEKTGKYCAFLFGSKKFREFWTEEYRRCRDGYKSHGYTITGFHYFFLNYYTLPLINKVKEAGSGRPEGFPDFTVAQYTWWHYLDMCKKKRCNAALMKARGLGQFGKAEYKFRKIGED